jgi:predicted nucleic acid-binding protein
LLARAAGSSFTVPDLWLNEVANALLAQERRKRIAMSGVDRALKLLLSLDFTVDAVGREVSFGLVIQLARQERLTVCDARYLELAIRKRLPLASLDHHLRASARRFGVELL